MSGHRDIVAGIERLGWLRGVYIACDGCGATFDSKGQNTISGGNIANLRAQAWAAGWKGEFTEQSRDLCPNCTIQGKQ